MLGTWGVQQTTRVHAAREHMQAVWISGVCGHSAGMPSSQLCWTGAPERHAVPALHHLQLHQVLVPRPGPRCALDVREGPGGCSAGGGYRSDSAIIKKSSHAHAQMWARMQKIA